MLRQLRPRSYNEYLELPIIGSLLDDFCQWSRQRGYTIKTIIHQLKDCRRISSFLGKRGVKDLKYLSELDFDKAWQEFHYDYPAIAGTVRQLEKFVKEKHGLIPKQPRPLSRSAKELGNFADHLRKDRGFEKSTINSYVKYLTRFLNFIGYTRNENALAELKNNKIDEFLIDCSKTLNRYSLQHVVAYLRTFLRYQFSRGILSTPLHEMIDTPRTYRLEKLPRSLPWDVVKKLLVSINRRESQGKRNYAILLMAATYGLRSIELIKLTLDDIGWRGKSISVRQQKTGNNLALPLTNEVADALIDYLRNARPNLPFREIFLRERAPLGRLKPTAVTEAFQREARLSGLNISYQGPHCLRHSLAVYLLRQGTSMKAIGDILGHRYPDSTTTYLRLAIDDLRSVALDVPIEPDNITITHAVKFGNIPEKRLVRNKIPSHSSGSFLADEISAYIRLHQGLGKNYRKEKCVLKSLDWFLINNSNFTNLNGIVFEEWSLTLIGFSPSERRNRMRIVRNFCIYRRRTNSDAFVPDILTFPAAEKKAKCSFILSSKDIARLSCVARQLSPSSNGPLRPAAIRMAILILYTCGLRREELLRLKFADYNSSEGTLFIRATKFHKQRIIPLSKTLEQELQRYFEYCRQYGVDMISEMPIICSYRKGCGWRPYTGTGLRQNWRYLCVNLGILTTRGIPPRLHDLRHSFAVNALLRCYHAGQDVQSKLPFLCTYMGHGCIASTHYYLSFIEPLQIAANKKFEQSFGNFIESESNLN